MEALADDEKVSRCNGGDRDEGYQKTAETDREVFQTQGHQSHGESHAHGAEDQTTLPCLGIGGAETP